VEGTVSTPLERQRFIRRGRTSPAKRGLAGVPAHREPPQGVSVRPLGDPAAPRDLSGAFDDNAPGWDRRIRGPRRSE
jgi:hypothetical protein